jgi:hypothetical protein
MDIREKIYTPKFRVLQLPPSAIDIVREEITVSFWDKLRVSMIPGGKSYRKLSHPDLRGQNLDANQMCARIKSHTYDDSWYRN